MEKWIGFLFFLIENNIAIYCSVQFHTYLPTWSSHSPLNNLSDNVTLSINKRVKEMLISR